MVSLSVSDSAPVPAGGPGGMLPSSISRPHVLAVVVHDLARRRAPSMMAAADVSLGTRSKLRSAGAPTRRSPFASTEWQRPLAHLPFTSACPRRCAAPSSRAAEHRHVAFAEIRPTACREQRHACRCEQSAPHPIANHRLLHRRFPHLSALAFAAFTRAASALSFSRSRTARPALFSCRARPIAESAGRYVLRHRRAGRHVGVLADGRPARRAGSRCR